MNCSDRHEISEKMDKFANFTVRNDKYRGIIIEKLTLNDDAYFLKYGDQPIRRHCEQVQSIVRKANVKRSKVILVNITEFSFEYVLNGEPIFKGRRLAKAPESNLNNEIGSTIRRVVHKYNREYRTQDVNKLSDSPSLEIPPPAEGQMNMTSK